MVWIGQLSESRCAAAHDFALAYQLGVELGAVEREVDVEVDAVEGALWGVHALEVLLEVLAAEIGSEGDNFLDACECVSDVVSSSMYTGVMTYEDPWCTRDTHPRRKRRERPRT